MPRPIAGKSTPKKVVVKASGTASREFRADARKAIGRHAK
jgi:hypothetical protein